MQTDPVGTPVSARVTEGGLAVTYRHDTPPSATTAHIILPIPKGTQATKWTTRLKWKGRKHMGTAGQRCSPYVRSILPFPEEARSVRRAEKAV